MRFNCLKAAEPLKGDSLPSTSKSPGIPSTHLIDSFERLSRPWSQQVDLSLRPTDWKSSATTIRPFPIFKALTH